MSADSFRRKMELLDFVDSKHCVTYGILAEVLHTSKSTIRRDVEELTYYYPLETVRGRDGGVRIRPGCSLSNKYLTKTQELTLLRIIPLASTVDQPIIVSIITRFGRSDRLPNNKIIL